MIKMIIMVKMMKSKNLFEDTPGDNLLLKALCYKCMNIEQCISVHICMCSVHVYWHAIWLCDLSFLFYLYNVFCQSYIFHDGYIRNN